MDVALFNDVLSSPHLIKINFTQMTKQSKLQLIPLILLGTTIIFAIHFKGNAINVIYLAAAVFLLLSSFFYSLYQQVIIHKTWQPLKLPHYVALLWIAWLFISINWSLVPNNSWYYSWVIAGMPMMFLLWHLLHPYCNIKHLWYCLLTITLFYAGWAIIEFISTTRAARENPLDLGIEADAQS